MSQNKEENPATEHLANILLVEDREEDVLFFRRAFKSADSGHAVVTDSTGKAGERFKSKNLS